MGTFSNKSEQYIAKKTKHVVVIPYGLPIKYLLIDNTVCTLAPVYIFDYLSYNHS